MTVTPVFTKTKMSDIIANGLIVVVPGVILLMWAVVTLNHVWHKYRQTRRPEVGVEVEDFDSGGRRGRRRGRPGAFYVIGLVSVFIGAILYATTTEILHRRGDKRADGRRSIDDIFSPFTEW